VRGAVLGGETGRLPPTSPLLGGCGTGGGRLRRVVASLGISDLTLGAERNEPDPDPAVPRGAGLATRALLPDKGIAAGIKFPSRDGMGLVVCVLPCTPVLEEPASLRLSVDGEGDRPGSGDLLRVALGGETIREREVDVLGEGSLDLALFGDIRAFSPENDCR